MTSDQAVVTDFERLSGRLSKTELLKRTYALYRDHLGTFFGLTVVPGLLGLLGYRTLHIFANQMVRGIGFRELIHHPGAVLAMGALNFAGLFANWFFYCAVLAAFAVRIRALLQSSDDDEHELLDDGYTKVRARLRPLLGIAFVTFVFLVVGSVFTGLPYFLLAFVHIPDRFPLNWLHWTLWVFVLWCISRYTLAVPLLVNESMSVWKALDVSSERTVGYRGLLTLLIIESVLGGFLANWVVFTYAPMVIRAAHLPWTEVTYWIVYTVAVVAAIAVFPPMFVGFCLVAEETSACPKF